MHDELIHASADWLFNAKEVRNKICSQMRAKEGRSWGGGFHIIRTGVPVGNFDDRK